MGASGCLWAKPTPQDTKGLSLPSLDSPKFLNGGPSARLQGAREKLRVMKIEIIGKPGFLVR